MGKTRDLFKKIRDTKGTFHAKIGTIKDRNDTDLIVAGDIKKRWQDYTEKLSSILAWRIPCTKEPCGLAHRVTESQTQLSNFHSLISSVSVRFLSFIVHIFA